MNPKFSNMPKMTKMARRIYDGFLKEDIPLSAESLSEKLGLPIRSIRYGINLLVKAGLVRKYQNLQDMRTTLYGIPKIENRRDAISIEI
ncbi:MAG: winged helix-turn-helix domain-containing protein [Candidatus Thorarchaeota archaeon]